MYLVSKTSIFFVYLQNFSIYNCQRQIKLPGQFALQRSSGELVSLASFIVSARCYERFKKVTIRLSMTNDTAVDCKKYLHGTAVDSDWRWHVVDLSQNHRILWDILAESVQKVTQQTIV